MYRIALTRCSSIHCAHCETRIVLTYLPAYLHTAHGGPVLDYISKTAHPRLPPRSI
jgi:hypothetical protein